MTTPRPRITSAATAAPAKRKSASSPRKNGIRDARPARRSRSRPQPKAARSETSPHVPLFRAALAVSLDGYIADAGHGVEWLNAYMSPEIDFAGFMRTIGAVVMGRKTYEISQSFGGGGSSDMPCVVLTHRPLAAAAKGVEAYNGDLHELAVRLRRDLAGSGKDIWLMGGGVAIDAFRAAGLVDRYELGVIPVLLGDGVPMFPRHSRGLEGLRLIESIPRKNGILSVTYAPDGTARR